MKQKIILYSICLCLFFACKKGQKAPEPDAKLYPISFNVSGFSQSAVPLDSKTKTNSLGTQATDTVPVQLLYYSLFDSNGGLVDARNVKKGDANFGQFNENVPAGNYKAVFCGGSNNLLAYRTFFTYIARPDIEGGPAYWDDTFFKLIPFTVTNTGINQSVTLSRATARLAIVLKDAIPTGTSKIVVKFQDTSAIGSDGLHHFQAANTTTKTITTADVGTTNYTIVMNTLNNIKPFDVTIDYYGANPSGPLGTKTIKNVVCKTNYITTLSGNLFTQGNAQFVLAIDQDWGAPVNVNF